MTVDVPESGLVVETRSGTLPILWTYFPSMPAEEVRLAAPWLTVVRWGYDGTNNNGMPNAEDNRHMLEFETVCGRMEDQEVCIDAYRRIGAGLREFVFYIADQDKFLSTLNGHLATHPRYPIEIKFYKDETWSELQDLIDEFKSL